MLEPLFLAPIFKDYIWGGTRLKDYMKKDTPYDTTAESWEVSTNIYGKSKICNAHLLEKDLGELFQNETIRETIFRKSNHKIIRLSITSKVY